MGIAKVRPLLALAALLLCGNAYGSPKPAASAAPIKEGYAVTNDGIRIHYLESGDSTSARALVLIPGWRLPAYLWNEQLERFSTSFRVIAVDPRSQGESTKTQDGNTPEFRARDMHDILAELKISRCVLVGWSQGAQDVAAYIQQFGTDSLAGAVFVDSTVSAGPGAIEIHKEASKTALTNIATYASYPREQSEGMVRYIFKQPHPELNMGKIVDFTMQTPTAIGVAMLTTDMFGADRWSGLAKMNKPALVIASADSPELDVEREMAATIAGAKFMAIQGAGHAVFVDQPGKFDEALGEFLRTKAQW